MRKPGFVSFTNCYSNDTNSYNQKLEKVIKKQHFHFEILGSLKNQLKDNIILISRKRGDHLPSLLISAGFHGEEPAGIWAILKFLLFVDEEEINHVNLSFLPIVNPTGIRDISRNNYLNENPNSNFCHNTDVTEKPSEEGCILLRHLEKLKILANDGFVSLHEDEDFDKFYLYTFENSDTPGDFSNMLRAAETQFFISVPDGYVENDKVMNGIIYKSCDGSFEDLMFHQGIPCTACTETPGKLDINLRIEANMHIIKQTIKYMSLKGK